MNNFQLVKSDSDVVDQGRLLLRLGGRVERANDDLADVTNRSFWTEESPSQTTSRGLGISILSFERLNLLSLAAMAAPPPRFAPGLAVEIYLVSFNSNSSSIFD